MKAVLEYDVWIYDNDGFIMMGTGQNSPRIVSYFWQPILSGYCQIKEIGY